MKHFSYVVQDELGIHARPAGLLVKLAKGFQSKITLLCADKSVDLTRLMMLMGMGVKRGDEVSVTAQGEDEDAAIAALEEFFEQNL